MITWKEFEQDMAEFEPSMQFNDYVKNRLRIGIAVPSDFVKVLIAAQNTRERDAIIHLESEGLVTELDSQSAPKSLVRLLKN